MRILYLSLSYLPSRRASSVQVTKTCAAFARRGHEVVLVAKRGREDTGGDDHAYYRVERNFQIEKVSRPGFRGGGVAYVAGMAAHLARRRRWADIVYCRDPVGALLATEAGLPVVFEAHEMPSSRWLRLVLARSMRRAVGLVAISDALRRDLIEASLYPVGRPIVVAHDACDPPPREAVRRAAGAPPVIGYVGSLYPGRGIERIVDLAKKLSGCRFRVVGGTEADLARWRASPLPPNLELLGFRPQAELPALYAAFDIVLMPHAIQQVLGASGSSDISRWTSPMKMFEYMASGVPLIASSLPVLQEVLRDGVNSLIVTSDETAAWISAIERLLADDELRYHLAHTAQTELLEHYTWNARARTVLMGLRLETAAAQSNGEAKPGGST